MSDVPGSSSQIWDVTAGIVEMYCYETGCDWKASEPANDPGAATRTVMKAFRAHWKETHEPKENPA